jgi:hypothetical protein
MLTVFDHVSMWRNNFDPARTIVALVASKSDFSLTPDSGKGSMLKQQALENKSWQDLPRLDLPINHDTVTLYYNGNLARAKHLFTHYPLNTDDLPIIEYKSPISIREKRADGLPPTLIAPRFIELTDSLISICPPDKDPVLANRSAANQRLPIAGYALQRAWVGFVMRDETMCQQGWNAFEESWLDRHHDE